MKNKPNPNRTDALLEALHKSGLPDADYNWVDNILGHLFNLGWDLNRTYKSDGEFPVAGRLVRDEDETGVSGTGTVAWIVEFPDGVAVTRWSVTDIRQTCVWESVDHVLAIHGHNGKTRLEWY
jgi:hypothetical protein